MIILALLFFLYCAHCSSSNSNTSGSSNTSISTTSSVAAGSANDNNDDQMDSGVTIVSANATNTVSSNLTYEYYALPNNNPSFNIGGLIPLSIDQEASRDGILLAESFKCSLNLINNNRGVVPNTSLTYSIQDTDKDINIAMNQALLLERRGTFAIVGPQFDNQVLPVTNLYNTISIPLISYGAGSTFLSNSTVFPTFFRTWPPDSAQARAMAETFRLLGWTFISALFTNDQYGQSGRSALLQATARQRIRITCLNNITPNATQGLVNFSDCLSTSDANVVVLWMDPQSASNAISVLYNNTLNRRITFVAANEWALITNITEFINIGERVTGLSYPPSYLQGALGFYPQIGSTALVRMCLSQVNPDNTDYPQFTKMWEREFKCRTNASDTLSICPKQTARRTGECRCDGSENLNQLPLPANINYIYDAVSVYGTALNWLSSQTLCSRLRPGNYCNLSEITSVDLTEAVGQVGLRGLTGDLSFNQTAPNRRRSYFDIFQYNQDAQLSQVGFWNISGVFLSSSALSWKALPDSEGGNGTTGSSSSYVPLSIIVPDNSDFADNLSSILITVLAIINILVAILMMIFFIMYRRTKCVKKSNLLYMELILVGVIFLNISIILWSVYQTKVWCTLKACFAFLGIGLVIGPIFAKTLRYFRIWTNYGQISPTMTFFELMVVVLVVMALELILFIIYFLPDGIPDRIVTQSQSDTTYLYISCVTQNPDYATIVIAIWLGLNGFLVLLGLLIHLIARNLVTPYHESKFILFTYLDIVILCAILIPIYYTTGDRKGSQEQQYLIRSLGLLFGSALTLLAMFAPKIISIHNHLKAQEEAVEGGGTERSTTYTGTLETSETEGSSVGEGRPQFYSDNVIRRSDSNNNNN